MSETILKIEEADFVIESCPWEIKKEVEIGQNLKEVLKAVTFVIAVVAIAYLFFRD